MKIDPGQSVYIVYTNWENKTAIRHILPQKLWFGHNEWHKEDQWILTAWDLDKDAERTFPMNEIHYWYTEEQKTVDGKQK
jgi:predicted DNA-binding transcriptional regulator YafY